MPLQLVALGRLLPLACVAGYAYNGGYTSAATHGCTAIAAQLRITCSPLYAELGHAQVLLSVSFRSSRPLPAAAALPLQCRSASSAGSAASSREPVQLRCRGSWSEGSGCAAERVRDRPAWWPGRRRRPSGNARPAAARRLCVGWGAGAASMAGAACFRFASGLRAAACLLRPLCCRFPRAALQLREHLPEGGSCCRFALALAGIAARASHRSRT